MKRIARVLEECREAAGGPAIVVGVAGGLEEALSQI
jgi:hypothetical protein